MKYRVENSKKILQYEQIQDVELSEILTNFFKNEKAWILFWEQYRVDFAWYDGKDVHWPEDIAAKKEYLMEVRVFNENREVHMRYVSERICGRVMTEISDEGQEQVQKSVYKKITEPYMWGSVVKDGVISEERGMKYHLPCSSKATNITKEIYYTSIMDILEKQGEHDTCKDFKKLCPSCELFGMIGKNKQGNKDSEHDNRMNGYMPFSNYWVNCEMRNSLLLMIFEIIKNREHFGDECSLAFYRIGGRG